MTTTIENSIPVHASEEWHSFRDAEVLTLSETRRAEIDPALLNAWEAGEDIQTIRGFSFPAPNFENVCGHRIWLGAKDGSWFRLYSSDGEDMTGHRGEPTPSEADVIRYATEADTLRRKVNETPGLSVEDIESALDRVHALEQMVLSAPMVSMDVARATVAMVKSRDFLTGPEVSGLFGKLQTLLAATDASASPELADAAKAIADFETQEKAALDAAHDLEVGGETDSDVVNAALYVLDRRLSDAIKTAAEVRSNVRADHRRKAEIIRAALSSGPFNAHGIQSADPEVALLKSLCADLIAAT